MPRYVKICFIFICLTLIHTGVCAQAEDQTKVYPLPLAEMEEVISSWLVNSGFAVRRSSSEAGKIIFYAARAEDDWQILLKQQSALATQVEVLLGAEDQAGHMPRELWDHISAYIKHPSDERGIELEGSNQDVPAAILSRIESVVCIREKTEDSEVQCSGFIVDDEGLILCTAHDLKDRLEVTVSFYDGSEVKGRVVKRDTHRDLALIRIGARLNAHIPLAGGRALIGMGERLYSIGCPVNLIGTVFAGAMNGPQRRTDDQIFWQVNMKIYPGSSGSPVFDVMGNLVAVVKGRYRGTDSVGFLIPLATVLEFVK
jgi:serine protease Do